MSAEEFFNLYEHGFIRAALCIPEVRVADVPFNAGQIVKLAREAAAGDAIFALFPELCLSAYSNEDLFHQEALLKSVRNSLQTIINETSDLNLILVVGAPLQAGTGSSASPSSPTCPITGSITRAGSSGRRRRFSRGASRFAARIRSPSAPT